MTKTNQKALEMQTQTTVAHTIDMLRRSFLVGLDERICRIETAWVTASAGCNDARDALMEIEFEAHRISGIAGSLGLAGIGTQARDLEMRIVEAREGALSSDVLSTLGARVDAFLDLMEQELINL